ncbi:MAG TPA: SufE family protein [Candidatus Solibacter sp.]|jgi:cysteine desulfuration protein SufE|nr:SufE family protein [Candidatus Solibacter sp.]
MNPIEARSHEIVRRLQVLPGAAERLAALTDRSRRLPPPRDDERHDAHLVPGCVSRVWLVGEIVGDRMQFRADADSQLVKGLVTLLWEITNDQPATDLAESPDEPAVLAALQLDGQLSPTRLHGVGQVWRRMRAFAREHFESSKS